MAEISTKDSRRKEKVLAVIIIATSIFLLLALMLTARILGRDMSLRQEILEKEFKTNKTSVLQNTIEQFRPKWILESFSLPV
jgi:hypothetical protein